MDGWMVGLGLMFGDVCVCVLVVVIGNRINMGRISEVKEYSWQVRYWIGNAWALIDRTLSGKTEIKKA